MCVWKICRGKVTTFAFSSKGNFKFLIIMNFFSDMSKKLANILIVILERIFKTDQNFRFYGHFILGGNNKHPVCKCTLLLTYVRCVYELVRSPLENHENDIN